LTPEGQPTPKPTWQADNAPSEVEADPNKITVYADRELKRFHVAIKRGDSFNFVLTDASTRKVRAEVEKAGNGAYYEFDYGDYNNCVIMVPSESMTLAEWSRRQEMVKAQYVERE